MLVAEAVDDMMVHRQVLVDQGAEAMVLSEIKRLLMRQQTQEEAVAVLLVPVVFLVTVVPAQSLSDILLLFLL